MLYRDLQSQINRVLIDGLLDQQEPDQWVQLEIYLSEMRGLEFSHGLCEECLEKHYPDPEKSSG